jgi:hypothetical protein
MRDHFKFWWRCLRHAWRGSWTRANELAAIAGAFIVTGLLWFFAPYLKTHDWVEAPTSYLGVTALTAVTAAASATAMFIVIFLTKFVRAPATLYWEEQRRAETLNGDLRRATADGQLAGPNWPIHELFSHLEPTALDEHEKNLWEDASLKIRDAASLGRLRIWGRLFKTDHGPWVGERASLREIEPAYWEKAFFTYWFFDATAGDDAAHCYADRNDGIPAYTDLQVNRGQVLELWPGEPDDIAESYPNVRVADSSAVLELLNGGDRAKLIGLLQAEKISSWARVTSGSSRDFIKLDGRMWTEREFLFVPKEGDDGWINQTFLRARLSSTHYDVCLNYAQLKPIWPNLKIARSDCSKG